VHNVLILCTGNSARSIIAEVLFNELGRNRYRAFSAGSKPVGKVNPGALHVLQAHGHAVESLHSKSWNAFSGDAAPSLHTVITVCDNAAAEPCPIWNGAPETLHWGMPDPAAVENETARVEAFETTYATLKARISHYLGGHRDA
jgi:arsenate reductase